MNHHLPRNGYSHKIGDLVAKLALKYRSVIILEDLEKLKESNKKSREFNKKLGLWFYRRIQFCIEYEARERGLEVIKINPKGTSSKCPRCGSKLVENENRVLDVGNVASQVIETLSQQ